MRYWVGKFVCQLILLSTILIGLTSGQRIVGSPSPSDSEVMCPTSCDDAYRYCVEKYGGGTGNISLFSCSNTTVTCACNSRLLVQVPWNATSCSPSPQFLFDDIDAVCAATSGVCPKSCNEAHTTFSRTCTWFQTGGTGDTPTCTEDGKFRCAQCDGSELEMTIIAEANDTTPCVKVQFPPAAPYCRPDCLESKHGCCSATSAECLCHRRPMLGYWIGAKCSQCDPYYQGDDCTKPVSQAQAFLNDLGDDALTMVTPLLACLVIFVVLSSVRRSWSYDKDPPPLHANFTDLLIEGKFKDKRIPDRPVASRGLVNRRKREQQQQQQ
eukprot:PhM_4_TR7126/c0_g1_i1/m.90014